MAENKNDFESVLTNLALVTDGIQQVFPTAKSVLLFELTNRDFQYVKSNFRNLKVDETQIKIDISGTEVVFILENSITEQEEIIEPVVVSKTKFQKFKELFFNVGSSPSVKN